MFAPTIEHTADGSATLRSPLTGETYHSTRGAVGESRHVFIESGFLATACDPVAVLEVGFGSGLNAWLTLLETLHKARTVRYTAVELYPVPQDIAARLGYTSDPRFVAMHAAEWGYPTEICCGFTLRKLNVDVTAEPALGGGFDVVYFDAFAPDTQPEMWTPRLFETIYEAMNPGGVLVTYSAKGTVRRAMQQAGFAVEKLPGALGKRHMLRATKN
ncbi:MAG: tRNA (5-methylaminomethyl-2-thiouridine)(34)-methyltransferase MnmD [Rikenellaceae bacterium]|nr:tRNA (5-methylaminomethyl-2-thiouridine)(34)-methyltransferase MnmD [Rikenellaceae bacterium]